MIDDIVRRIVAESEKAGGQDAAARIHSVLMNVRQEVARVIVDAQRKERLKNKLSAANRVDSC